MNSGFPKELKEFSLKQVQDKYGKQCPFVNLENDALNLDAKHSGLVMQIKDLQTIRNDLKFVASWLDILINIRIPPEVKVNISTSLWFSSIITYAKCFTSAEGKTRLDQKHYFKGESAEVKAMHKNIMDIRHTYIAHGSGESLSKTEVFLTLNTDSIHRELLGVDGISYSKKRPKTDELKAYKATVVMVHNKLDNIIVEKEKILYEGLKTFKSTDEWYNYITD